MKFFAEYPEEHRVTEGYQSEIDKTIAGHLCSMLARMLLDRGYIKVEVGEPTKSYPWYRHRATIDVNRLE